MSYGTLQHKRKSIKCIFYLFVNCRVLLLGPQLQRKICKNYQPYQLLEASLRMVASGAGFRGGIFYWPKYR